MREEVSRLSGSEVHPPSEIFSGTLAAFSSMGFAEPPQTQPSAVPDGWREISLGMSNYEHSIDDGLDEALRETGVYSRHAGWNFNGLVWFEGGQFKEEVWQYHEPQEILSAHSLRDLMEVVNDKWGWD